MIVKVPLIDLESQYLAIKAEIDAAVAEVFKSQQFVLGPHVKSCEDAVAEYSGCEFGVGVSSGTDALLIAMMAEGIGRGDEVITTPYTFFATAGCIVRTGAKPIFVEIDPESYNINPASIEEAITPRTRAIIPVHLFGRMADMVSIMTIADQHGLIVIEDAAQAIGAEYRGRRAGSYGHYGCFSFFPSKNLGGAGDGGMVVTTDADRCERMKIFRAHGASPKFYHKVVGGNFRLDAIQAAVVEVKLRHLDAWTDQRQRNARLYREVFADRGLDDIVRLPGPTTDRHIYNQFVVRVPERDGLRTHLRNAGIESEIYYPKCLHQQECFSDLGYRKGDFPEAEKAASKTLAIPIHAELSIDQQQLVVATVHEFIGEHTWQT